MKIRCLGAITTSDRNCKVIFEKANRNARAGPVCAQLGNAGIFSCQFFFWLKKNFRTRLAVQFSLGAIVQQISSCLY